LPDGSRPPVWFAFDDSRPLAFFAGIWTRWTSVRKVREGETTNDLFGFLTTDPNAIVGAVHAKAMPVILTKPDEIEVWMSASAPEALKLQCALQDDALRVVARGLKEDVAADERAARRPIARREKSCDGAPSGNSTGTGTRLAEKAKAHSPFGARPRRGVSQRIPPRLQTIERSSIRAARLWITNKPAPRGPPIRVMVRPKPR
jgi:hypothetical protein